MVESLSYMLLLMVPEQFETRCETGTVHTARAIILVFCPCFVFVLWFFVLSFVYPFLEISVT